MASSSSSGVRPEAIVASPVVSNSVSGARSVTEGSSTALAAVAAIVDFDLFFVFVGLVLGGDEAVLQDRVEVGLDVVRINEVLVVIIVFGGDAAHRCFGGKLVFLLLLVDDLRVEIFVRLEFGQ